MKFGLCWLKLQSNTTRHFLNWRNLETERIVTDGKIDKAEHDRPGNDIGSGAFVFL